MSTPLPRDSLPLEPRHGEVVAGPHARLRWDPTPGAPAQRLQVSAAPTFDEGIFEYDLPAEVDEIDLELGSVPAGQTFYWRVLAGGNRGWSAGDHIESFVIGARDDVVSGGSSEFEPLGPAAELFRVAGLQAHAELTPGRQPAAERAVGGRPEGLEGAEIVTVGMTFVIATGVFLAVLVGILLYAC